MWWPVRGGPGSAAGGSYGIAKEPQVGVAVESAFGSGEFGPDVRVVVEDEAGEFHVAGGLGRIGCAVRGGRRRATSGASAR